MNNEQNAAETPFDQIRALRDNGWSPEMLRKEMPHVSLFKITHYSNVLFTEKEAAEIARIYDRELGE